MTDPSFTPEAERELLVVYPTRERAEEAREALLRAGIEEGDIRLDAEPDRVASLRAEMHEELTRAWVVPNAGVAYTKESARAMVMAVVIGSVIGLAAAPLLAIPDFGTTYLNRLLIFAIVGVVMGSTIGLVAGPAIGARRPAEDGAAAGRGTLLRVTHDSPELRSLLGDLDPIRMDEVGHDDQPIATVATEGEDRLVKDTAQDLAVNVKGDDYHADERRTGSQR
jgi:hypothetical protein